jgi:hypothetical protein
MFRLLKSITFLSLVSIFLAPAAVFAQSIPGVSEPVTIVVSPQFPAPNTNVYIAAQSFSTDLSRAAITWVVNGKLFKKGVGATAITVPSGAAGSQTRVSISVATTDLGTIESNVSFRPAGVSLVWQSDGYTPPFYRGKALEAYGADFRVVALPELYSSAGRRIDPKTLVYAWKLNDEADQEQSGYGKDSYSGRQSSYVRGGDTVSVEVTSTDRSIGATAATTISPTTPEILFYESSPLYGVVFEKALGDSLPLAAEELSLRAEPYGLSTGKGFAGATFDWTMNGAAVPAFKDKPEITLRKAGAIGGQSEVGVSVQESSRILQGGQAAITIFQ